MKFRRVVAIVAALFVAVFLFSCSEQTKNPLISENSDLPDELIQPVSKAGMTISPQSYSLSTVLQKREKNVSAAPAGTSWITVVNMAFTWLGVPYQWGGNSRSGIDCSHLVYQVYRQSGAYYPRYLTVSGIKASPWAVTTQYPMPGDLVLFGYARHVGIYLWGGYFIDANYAHGEVTINNIYDRFWQQKRPYFAKWILGQA